MATPTPERWPPIYDEEDLKATIDQVASGDVFFNFFLPTAQLAGVCQGDVVALHGPVPLFDEHGEPVAQGRFEHWLVIGNTCDYDRSLKDVRWTQIVPIDDWGRPDDVAPEVLDALRKFTTSRMFYLPPWVDGTEHTYVADFLRPVAIDKSAFSGPARVVARLDYKSWILLHCCLVRFLARGDGRFED